MTHNHCVNVSGLLWCDNSKFVVPILPQWRLLPSSAFLSFFLGLHYFCFYILHWYSYSWLFVWIQIWLSCAVFHKTDFVSLFEKIEREETNKHMRQKIYHTYGTNVFQRTHQRSGVYCFELRKSIVYKK